MAGQSKERAEKAKVIKVKTKEGSRKERKDTGRINERCARIQE